jgi:hypothetical protein
MGLKSFKFEMSSFSDGGAAVKLKNGKLVIEGRVPRYIEPTVIKPTDEEWAEFLEVVDRLNVWGWKADYCDPYISDGTQWELSMSKGTSKIKCDGSNDYPPEFDEFVKAVNKLSGSDFYCWR